MRTAKSKNGYRWHPKNANNFYWQDQQYLLSYHSIKWLNISDHENNNILRQTWRNLRKDTDVKPVNMWGTRVRSTTGYQWIGQNKKQKGTQNRKCIIIRNLQSSIKTFKYHPFENKEHWLHHGNQGWRTYPWIFWTDGSSTPMRNIWNFSKQAHRKKRHYL